MTRRLVTAVTWDPFRDALKHKYLISFVPPSVNNFFPLQVSKQSYWNAYNPDIWSMASKGQIHTDQALKACRTFRWSLCTHQLINQAIISRTNGGRCCYRLLKRPGQLVHFRSPLYIVSAFSPPCLKGIKYTCYFQ